MKIAPRILLGLVMVAAGWAYAMGDFEGEVDMKVNRLNTKDNIVKYFVKGHKGKFLMDSNDGKYSGSGIYDWKTNQIIVLMDKQKMYMVMQAHPEKFHYENKNNFKITKTGNSENILGYECQEWDYTSGDENGKIWFTSGIGNWWANEMAAQSDKLPPDQRLLVKLAIEKKLFPMKWESDGKTNSYRNSGEVVKIEKQSLSNSLFEVPVGYRKFDMGALLGGGGDSGNSSKKADALGDALKKLSF